MSKKLTTVEFVERANKSHKYKYIYVKTHYVNMSKKVVITCKEHGDFLQDPRNHLYNNRGCPKCKREKISSFRAKTLDEYMKQVKKIHGNKYDYSKVIWQEKGRTRKICIICRKHGEFVQRVNHHLTGSGCPYCRESKGEKMIEVWLKKYKVDYRREYSFPACKRIKVLRFDFFLPKLNICIEFDGPQHYDEKSHYYNKDRNLHVKDQIKNNFCKQQHIRLIRIKYKNAKKINQILSRKIFKFKIVSSIKKIER